MSPEEVIERLKTIFAFGISNCIADKIARDTTFAALEKQIPKKPERLNAFKAIGKCGGCERVISTRTASVYCQYCGNKVDWGNED